MYTDAGFGNLELLIQERIDNILQADPAEFNINWNLIKILGDLLKIQNYSTNPFSSWILRSLLQQLIYNADSLNKSDYTLFIYWIFEEINIIRYNTDMPRANFFRLINQIFQMAMTKILEGQGLLHPLQLFSQFWEDESESISKMIIAKCDSENTFSMKNEGESTSNIEMHADPAFESTIKYYEKVLHAIINTSYELFSREPDYALIQIACCDEINAFNYSVPYHFRKPRIVKKVETSQKPYNTSNSKQGQIKKTRKLSRKSSSDNLVLASTDRGNHFKENNYILPLSDAFICQDFAELAERTA